jgi:hypothetical protein
VPKYCQSGGQRATPDDWLDGDEDNYEVPKMPSQITLPGQNTTPIPIERDTLTYNFDLNDEGIHCYIQFFLRCKTLFKTAGLGDTISGTGFIYHTPKYD